MSVKGLSKSRRNPTSLITEPTLHEEERRIRGIFRSLARGLPPPQAPEGTRRLERVLLEAEKEAALAALVYLREFNLPIYKACIASALNHAKLKAQTGEAEFRFFSSKALKNLSRSPFLPLFQGLYSEIQKTLRSSWDQKLDPGLLHGPSHYVSLKRRYGAKQKLGTWRHHAMIRSRVAAVCDTVEKFATGEDGLAHLLGIPCEVSESLARKWVIQYRSPARMAMQILAHYTGLKPRTVKALLNRSRRLLKS